MTLDKWGHPVKHYDPAEPWPFRHIPEEPGREVMRLLSNVSYHRADDSGREMGDASREMGRLVEHCVDQRMHPGHVEQLVQLHRGLVSADEVLRAMIHTLYSKVDDGADP